MVYSDLLFFLGILPFSVLLSFLDRSTEYKNLILVLTSLVFFSWGKPFAVCLIFLTAFAEWLFGLWIEKWHGKGAVLPLILDFAMNTSVFLIFTKRFLYIKSDVFGYADIFSSLAVGFYVLKGFSYAFDVFRQKTAAERNVFYLLTYMSAYFLLPTGPVISYSDIKPQLKKRNLSLDGMNSGLNSFIYGLGKAVIIAPVLRKIGETGLNFDEINFVGCWTGIIAMLGFGYFVFTGFCDMSYGLGRIYGFEFDKNYGDLKANGIYKGLIKSCNTSLVQFCENAVPKNNNAFKYISVLILSVIAALWYHQSKGFLIVGAVIGIIVILESTLLKGFFEKAPAVIRFIAAYFTGMIIFGGLYFSSFSDYGKWIKGLFGIGTKYMQSIAVRDVILNNLFILIIAFIIAFTPLKNAIKNKVLSYSNRSVEKYGKIHIAQTFFTALLLVVCIIIAASANVKL